MKPSILVGVLSFSTLGACHYVWGAPDHTQKRSPCPMLNTFANHGYINRDGLGISIQDLQFAFETAINLDPAAAQVFGARALLVSTTGDSTTFNLDDLKAQGGTLQHDGSLSRADLYFGDVLSFNESVWAPTAARFNEKTIDLATAEAARKARLAEAKATNPEFNMTDADLRSSATETALYMAVFAEPDVPNEARAEWVKVLFEQERLPVEEGWTRNPTILKAAPILATAAQILAA